MTQSQDAAPGSCLGCQITSLVTLGGSGAWVMYNAKQAKTPTGRALMMLGGAGDELLFPPRDLVV